MNKILDFVNSKYKDSFRFDRCEKLSDDLNGIAVTSEIDSNYGEWLGNYSCSFIPEYDIS